MQTKNQKIILVISGVSILFLLFFAFQVPLCHDEWKWGSEMRWELFRNGFQNYNGRYLGNLIVIFAVRNTLVKVLVIVSCIFATIWMLFKNVDKYTEDKYKPILYLIIIFMALTIPKSLFRQSYAWVAALINFVPPVILILLYFKIIEHVFQDEKPVYSKLQCILVIPLGICTQLFSEHTTIYLVVLSFAVMLYSFIKHKKMCLFHVLYFTATVIGAIVMFSNEAYWSMTDETYKQLITTFTDIIKVYAERISGFLFLDNWILNGFITINLGILVIKNSETKNKKLINITALLICVFYTMVSTITKLNSDWTMLQNVKINSVIYTFLSVAFFISTIILIMFNIDDKSSRYSISLYYILGAAVSIPLLIASPIGERCFFASYMFMVLAGVRMISYSINKYQPVFDYKKLNLVCACIVLSIMFFYTTMFRSIGKIDRYRQKLIKENVSMGAEVIDIPELPYKEYIWLTTPPDKSWEKYYKEFYNIPKDTRLNFY